MRSCVAAVVFAALPLAGCSCSYTVGGNVTGLQGAGLVLQNDGADNLSITKDGPFAFKTKVSGATPYFVTVLTQPSSPAQTCTVSPATGTAGKTNITDIAVNCTTNAYAIDGTVTGMVGTGLVLQDNDTDGLPVVSDGVFSFAHDLIEGVPYSITVQTQPTAPSQTCTVTNGAGLVGTSTVGNVLVTCATDTFTVGGTIEGLAGSGLVLQNNGSDDVTVTSGSAFVFPTPIVSGGFFNVSVLTQPGTPDQTCIVSGGSGTVGTSPVTSIDISCTTNAYTVGGTVSGLSGNGLVLQDNGGDDLAVTSNGWFVFATPLVSGASFDVSVLGQPASPTQTCTVTGASGSVIGSAVTSVEVSCTTNSFPVSGTVAGLSGSGLVLENDGQDELSLLPGAATFAFTMPIASGAPYSVTVSAQPTRPSQTCVVSNDPRGVVGQAAVADVALTCTTNSFPLSVNVLGLLGSGLLLQNGQESLAIASSGLATFAGLVPSGGAYSVAILTQPTAPVQVCSIASPAGAVTTSGVTLTATCVTTRFAVSVTVSGLGSSPVVLQDNGEDNLSVTDDGTQTFATSLPSGGTYSVSILTQPIGSTCSVISPAGAVTDASVSINVTCTVNDYAVGGTVTGLRGGGLVLANGSSTISATGDGAFAFPDVPSGSPYNVQVQTQPTSPAQTCSVSSGQGNVAASQVTSILVTCVTNTYPVSVNVSGLTEGTLIIQDSGSDSLDLTQAGVAQFATPVASGATYSVAVATQPAGETCTVSPGSGVVGSAPVTVRVLCSLNSYAVGGTVIGLRGSGLTLRNGGDTVAVTGDGSFVVDSVVSGSAYDVEVERSPTQPSQTCTATTNTGLITSANVASVRVTCVTNTYPLSAIVEGLSGSGLVLQDTLGDELVYGASGVQSFPTRLPDETPFAVVVAAQPSSPSGTCAVFPAEGLVEGGPANVVVMCSTNSYSVGGTVTGLLGPGLVLQSGAVAVNVIANGAFALPPTLSGSGYDVVVGAQPSSPSQSCAVTNGAGTIGGANVTDIVVACVTNTFPVQLSVTGLLGSGLTLENNGTDQLAVTTPGIFTFATQVPSGSNYSVNVTSQPSSPAQQCTAANASGLITTSAITVPITCTTSTFNVGGWVTGLAGAGLVVRDDADGSEATIAVDGPFLVAGVPSGSPYSISVVSQPSSPIQTCTVSSSSGVVGSADVTDVLVTCVTSTYSLGVTVTGLSEGALQLQNNGGETLTVTTDGPATFGGVVPSGSGYDITVASQPPGQTCAVESDIGIVTNSNVALSVTCVPNAYAYGGIVTGLLGSGLVLQGGFSSLSISSNGSFAFPPINSGSGYSVSIAAQPTSPTQSCAVASGSGTVTTAPVTNIVVSCTTSVFSLSASVTGLAGVDPGLVLLDEDGDTLVFNGSATQTFATQVPSGGAYFVAIATQPTFPQQACMVQQPTGLIASSAVTVSVVCTTNAYVVGGTVTGLTGAGLLLANGTSFVSVSTNGAFNFPAVASGSTYNVSVTDSPMSPSQSCVVTSGSGTVTSSNVTSVQVSCTTNSFAVSVLVTGLSGAGLVLQDNGGDNLPITSNGVSTFATKIASSSTYTVTVLTEPASPTQSCSVASASGTVSNSNVDVSVTCTTIVTSSGCASGTTGQQFSSNMQGCDCAPPASCSVAVAEASALCAPGWTVCDLAEWTARRGSAVSANIRYITAAADCNGCPADVLINSTQLCAPNDACQGYYYPYYVSPTPTDFYCPGWPTGIANGNVGRLNLAFSQASCMALPSEGPSATGGMVTAVGVMCCQ